eukprot:TRINITY_DN1614_c0_g2_i1.p2 TRINITY_DN1614_c0_g2~~TRINITY_DN1614_c0_g2_i1.p2  ORF type:complete len:200 (-),score=7.19 TRINITY_DN1614_c0_g2_i1:372-971(-)
MTVNTEQKIHIASLQHPYDYRTSLKTTSGPHAEADQFGRAYLRLQQFAPGKGITEELKSFMQICRVTANHKKSPKHRPRLSHARWQILSCRCAHCFACKSYGSINIADFEVTFARKLKRETRPPVVQSQTVLQQSLCQRRCICRLTLNGDPDFHNTDVDLDVPITAVEAVDSRNMLQRSVDPTKGNSDFRCNCLRLGLP